MGDSFCIQETPGQFRRVGIHAYSFITNTLSQLHVTPQHFVKLSIIILMAQFAKKCHTILPPINQPGHNYHIVREKMSRVLWIVIIKKKVVIQNTFKGMKDLSLF